MEEHQNPSADAVELRKLQARAYGQDADLIGDPAALARLAELEDRRLVGFSVIADHQLEVEQPTDAEPDDTPADDAPSNSVPSKSSPPSETTSATRHSTRRRDLSPRMSGPVWLAVGAGVTVIASAWGVTQLLGPSPDARLSLTANELDDESVSLIDDDVGLYDVDKSTLVSYATYRGVEPWSGVDLDGNPCLLLVDRSASRVLEVACTPPEGDLIADLGAWPALDPDFAEGLAHGSVLRFRHHDDSVDAFLITPPDRD